MGVSTWFVAKELEVLPLKVPPLGSCTCDYGTGMQPGEVTREIRSSANTVVQYNAVCSMF